jgi:hypothetical protein
VTMSDNKLCSLEIATLLCMTYGVHKTGHAAGAQDGTRPILGTFTCCINKYVQV